MKIKEQTRKLAAAVLEYGKATLTWFEEIFEEYKSLRTNHYPVVTKKKLRQTELNFFFSVVSAMLVLHLTFYLIRQIQD
ncbi:hypothetical protein [Streptococcus pneumoniae]|uniref:hypothetical protein n=1 Tax=Streptococcus pneumoniae TaxID=1313 RepID=UPI0009917D21|nr:hypothetical protein [Streptococcus pneumoniae]